MYIHLFNINLYRIVFGFELFMNVFRLIIYTTKKKYRTSSKHNVLRIIYCCRCEIAFQMV